MCAAETRSVDEVRTDNFNRPSLQSLLRTYWLINRLKHECPVLKAPEARTKKSGDMEEAPPPKKIRKGAKSCTECRRRKVRCVWLSDDSHACRRCEERGTACVAQIFSSQLPRAEGLGSKDRILRLEKQVTSLTKALNDVQNRLGGPKVSLDPFTEDDNISASSDDTDAADLLDTNPPTYLQDLFDNDVIQSGRHKGSASLLQEDAIPKSLVVRAREKLRKLIPPRHDVEVIAKFASAWLGLYQTLFPTNTVAMSEEDILQRYLEILSPDVGPNALATWLITVAITVNQLPQDALTRLTGIKKPAHFCNAVCEAVDACVIGHDALIGTMSGLGTALHFLRLQAGRPNFKKLWFLIRRIIAAAELLGLPKSARALENEKTHNGVSEDSVNNDLRVKAETWMSICTLDRIFTMMSNLPPGTTKYPIPFEQTTGADSPAFMRNYMRTLADIAARIHELDNSRLLGTTDRGLDTEIQKIDQELLALANSTPKSWWAEDASHDLPHKLVTYLHNYVTVRVHLPLSLKTDVRHQFDYSQLTCMTACRITLKKFLTFRPHLSSGFFLSRLLDVQVLTATVVLLLMCHRIKPGSNSYLEGQLVQPAKEVIAQLVTFLGSISNQAEATFAKHSLATIQSLRTLLEDNSNLATKDLVLRVPLLGKIHVHRNRDVLSTSKANHKNSLNFNGTQGSIQNDASGMLLSSTQDAHQIQPVQSTVDNWSWDPLTWSVEDDGESLYRDALLAEDLNYFGTPFDYNNFEFGV